MAFRIARGHALVAHSVVRLLIAAGASLAISACSSSLDADLGLANAPPTVEPDGTVRPRSDAQKSAEASGKAFAENPKDLDLALTHARNLKALGLKSNALAVLQKASLYHGTDRKLASEYGRLALDLDQLALAKQLLARADDPTNPDWRVVSAQGTVLAKEGKYQEAIAYYQRARDLAGDQHSILNNLALAQTMSGQAPEAEALLRTAVQSPNAPARLKHNYALSLSVQGRHDEAQQAAMAVAPDTAAADTDYLRKLVKAPALPMRPDAVFASYKPDRPSKPSDTAWTTTAAGPTPAAPDTGKAATNERPEPAATPAEPPALKGTWAPTVTEDRSDWDASVAVAEQSH
jgi:Flp pilus assembly protein TadD